MCAIASQITSVSIVCSTVCSGADLRIYRSFALLAFVRGIHRWPVASPHKGPVVREMFPFDNAIMGILSIWPSNLTVCSPTFIMFTPSGMPWTRPGLSLAVGRPILDCFPQVNTSWKRRKGTVVCRYTAVEYNTIMHTPLHWLRQNINQCLHSQKTPHILSLQGELWVVYCEYFGGNWPRYNGAALCNAISLKRQCRHVEDRCQWQKLSTWQLPVQQVTKMMSTW